MKKTFFSLMLFILGTSSLSYCMTLEQRALVVTESLKDRGAIEIIQNLCDQYGEDRDSIEVSILSQTFKELDLCSTLAKWYYLLCGIKLENSELNYGFSIDELRVFNKLPAITLDDLFGNTLNLEKLKINDLTGLKNVPNISHVHFLNLANNQIAAIQPNTFVCCNELTKLCLASNNIKDVPKNAFNGLPHLDELSLAYNRIDELPNSLLDGLNNLNCLHLGGIQAARINSKLFEGHRNLQFLYYDVIGSSEQDSNSLRSKLKVLCPRLRIFLG